MKLSRCIANVPWHIKSRTQGQKGAFQVPGHRPIGRLLWSYLGIHCRMHPALDRWLCQEAIDLTPEMLTERQGFDQDMEWPIFGLFLSFFDNEK